MTADAAYDILINGRGYMLARQEQMGRGARAWSSETMGSSIARAGEIAFGEPRIIVGGADQAVEIVLLCAHPGSPGAGADAAFAGRAGLLARGPPRQPPPDRDRGPLHRPGLARPRGRLAAGDPPRGSGRVWA